MKTAELTMPTLWDEFLFSLVLASAETMLLKLNNTVTELQCFKAV